MATSRRRPFVWGEHDCTLCAADWVLERRGFDLAAGFRGSYSTADECRALLKRGGGLVAVVSAAASHHGLEQTDAPTIGDVGVVRAPVAILGGRRAFFAPVASVRTPAGWFLLAQGGASVDQFEVLKAWRV